MAVTEAQERLVGTPSDDTQVEHLKGASGCDLQLSWPVFSVVNLRAEGERLAITGHSQGPRRRLFANLTQAPRRDRVQADLVPVEDSLSVRRESPSVTLRELDHGR